MMVWVACAVCVCACKGVNMCGLDMRTCVRVCFVFVFVSYAMCTRKYMAPMYVHTHKHSHEHGTH